MSRLDDEILNKYIDGELEADEFDKVSKILSSSVEDNRRFLALQRVHDELRNAEVPELSPKFTAAVMSKIKGKAKLRKKDRAFAVTLGVVFVGACLFIIGFVLFNLPGGQSAGASSGTDLKIYVNAFTRILESFSKFFTSTNISIIGSIISFGLLISGYFFFESIKHTKNGIGKLH
jgi:hypothetical protein